ncbi:MAG: histidine--tRNA ligase [Candidatus Portnoybacteria bacterium RIFCSPLOWO2_02_FULL_39_11]|uniref:Histidine--tRNA ligase n=1 Tax=Candidatus Portnoybacteria bacterium RIFCSPLOWO2_02_FULL_39_11 TaxID=1802001 RepID=A0A1G2FW75_9BACT|nr:MAG: histidine--tRNA ligase [Candidatus Portnoybacteria bacterium RIFCSPLOWO2_02_FULL_39_11]
MRDLLPQDWVFWDKLVKTSQTLAEDYGFQKIETPLLEDAELFIRGTGATTDIVGKEMYFVKTAGAVSLALRPEGTPGVVRAYLENGMASLPQPIKLFYYGPMFRHEQPQAGRWRQFYQLGLEIFGDSGSVLDAQLIQFSFHLLRMVGLKKTNIQINSLGCPQCRPTYRKAIVDYYRHRKEKVCPDCRRRLKENPFRLLDCKEEKCQPIKAQAPAMVDYLCDECRKHFKEVLEFLDELELPYFLNNSLVRGLDYYTKTVFEIFWEEEGAAQLALGGGGRYDDLVKELGGKPTPAVGVALGLDRIVDLMKKERVKVSNGPNFKVFLVQLGLMGKKKSLKLFEKLHQAGIPAAESMSRDSIKAQMKIADKLGVKFALILGQQEALDGTIIIRDMQSGVQETVSQEKVVDELKKRFKK